MARQQKISLSTKFLSNRHYLTEVPVEGKKAPTFHLRLSNYGLYVAQIIRTGNCVTLLSTPFAITENFFWNTNHFEDIAKYVFWTFNRSFLLKLLDQVETQKLSVLHRCRDLLKEYPTAYPEPLPDDSDEELSFCYSKNGFLKKDINFQTMYSLDEQNRKFFMEAVEKRIGELSPTLSSPESTAVGDPGVDSSSKKAGIVPLTPFLQLVRPMNGNPEETLQYITTQTELAGFEFPLFSPVQHLASGKNPYGFNGAMAAMLKFFYDRNYFIKEHGFVEVFNSYLQYSGNRIPKLRSFLASYQDDRHFQKYISNLKDLKINKLP
jgi:hypothetical protein